MMTFFTPKANDIVGTDCDSLVTSLENPDPKEFPAQIERIIGKQHIFQFHYNTDMKRGPQSFIFDDILDKQVEPKQLENKPSGTNTKLLNYQCTLFMYKYLTIPFLQAQHHNKTRLHH